MSNREPNLYFLDIFIAFDKISRYTKRFTTAQEFLNSELEGDATIRELEIIGEATNNLINLNLIDTRHRRIVDFRNQIIHGYFGIDEDIVFEVIKEKLVLYINDLKSLNIDFSGIIKIANIEHSGNKNILSLLEGFEEHK